MTVDDSAPSFSVRDLPPVPWVRERDVDLLLARLFATQPPLIEWFTSRAMAPDRSLPTGDPVEVHAAINFHRHGAEGHATGETDVLVEATYAGGTLLMSIENKTWAAPQDRQGERHVAFVRASGRAWCLAAVVAPKFWLDSHDTEVRVYDIAVPLEELAGWCGDQPANLGFCSSVFDQACRPPVVDFAPDLQEWNTRINEILVEHHQLQLAPTQHTRTKSIGQARPGRYISCASDTLPFVPGVGRPWLRLKTSSANYDARADIELAKAPPELVDAIRPAAETAGYVVRTKPKGTLIVTNYVAAASGWTTGPFEEQEPMVRAVAQGASDLRDWWCATLPGLHWQPAD